MLGLGVLAQKKILPSLESLHLLKTVKSRYTAGCSADAIPILCTVTNLMNTA